MRYPESWGEFPDVTDPNEPDIPATDASESELKAAGAYRMPNPAQSKSEGNESWL